jgi:hypothetical protein
MLHCATAKSNLLLCFVSSLALPFQLPPQQSPPNGGQEEETAQQTHDTEPISKVAKPVVGTGM